MFPEVALHCLNVCDEAVGVQTPTHSHLKVQVHPAGLSALIGVLTKMTRSTPP